MVSKPEMIIDSATRRAATRRASKIKQRKQSKQAKLAKRVSANPPGSCFQIILPTQPYTEKYGFLTIKWKRGLIDE